MMCLHGNGRLVYQRDQLLKLSKIRINCEITQQIPMELKRKRRGCRAGVKQSEKRWRFKPFLPTVMMGNVRSLANKTDELEMLTRSQREYRQCSLMCFTETWLHENIPDCSVSVHGFKTLRADRSQQLSGKLRGGGIAVLVNQRWCHPGHVTIKEKICTRDIELLAVSLRPYYLPREFTCVILVAVYIVPGTAPDAACDVISSVIARLQTQYPNSVITISGDFNNVSLSAALPTFQQFVSCSTRENKTLDLFYANIKNAYSCSALPPLGRSDHNLVLLTSTYKPIVQQQPVITKTIKTWSNEAEDALKGCFEATDWNALCQPHGDNINAMTECVTDYINFCVDIIVPTRTVKCFPNNKSWITTDLKKLLNIKKKAFRDGNRELLKTTQKQIKAQTRKCKEDYRKKLESQLQHNNVRDVWSGMKKITGFKAKGDQTDGGLDRANELNRFFNRFSSPPVSSPTDQHPP